MENGNSELEIQKDYSKLINNNIIIKHYVQGMSRFLILWIIKFYGPIHGYAILKELDKFFDVFIIERSLKQSNPSNIYPILNKLEDNGLISSELKMKNKKQLKYFSITSDGQYVLDYIYSKFNVMHNNSQWKALFGDMD